MDQKTKICSGKHGCGGEFPIEMFYFNKRQNNYQTYCKVCVNKQARIWENAHKDRKAKRMHLYHQTESGKAVLKRAMKKYRETEAGKEWFRAYWKKYITDGRDGYIVMLLKSMKIEDFTPEFIETKRAILMLHREANGNTRKSKSSIN